MGSCSSCGHQGKYKGSEGLRRLIETIKRARKAGRVGTIEQVDGFLWKYTLVLAKVQEEYGALNSSEVIACIRECMGVDPNMTKDDVLSYVDSEHGRMMCERQFI